MRPSSPSQTCTTCLWMVSGANGCCVCPLPVLRHSFAQPLTLCDPPIHCFVSVSLLLLQSPSAASRCQTTQKVRSRVFGGSAANNCVGASSVAVCLFRALTPGSMLPSAAYFETVTPHRDIGAVVTACASDAAATDESTIKVQYSISAVRSLAMLLVVECPVTAERGPVALFSCAWWAGHCGEDGGAAGKAPQLGAAHLPRVPRGEQAPPCTR